MAAIDKTYVTKEELIEAIQWANNVGVVTLENGHQFKPLNWIRGYNTFDLNVEGFSIEDREPGLSYILWNTPTWMDRWLWVNCPLPFVKERLEEVYDETMLREFETWTYIKPEFRKNQRFTFLKTPSGPYWKWFMSNARRNNPWPGNCKQATYYCEVRVPGYEFEHEYDPQVDQWYPMFGLLPTDTAHTYVWQRYHKRIPSKKAIIRQLRKWNLPKGTIVKLYSRYDGLTFKVLVK